MLQVLEMLPFGGETPTNCLPICVRKEGTQERSVGTKRRFLASLEASETQTLDPFQRAWTGPLSDSLIPLGTPFTDLLPTGLFLLARDAEGLNLKHK